MMGKFGEGPEGGGGRPETGFFCGECRVRLGPIIVPIGRCEGTREVDNDIVVHDITRNMNSDRCRKGVKELCERAAPSICARAKAHVH
jgi:hypothetical protein